VTTETRRFLTPAAWDAEAFGRLGGLAMSGLWVAGSLAGLAAPTVAIVGTRAPSDGGVRLARRLARDLATAGVCVVSGLALGIDAAAHAGALDAGGPTIGVLGGGHDQFFPRRNRELGARMIAAGGAVISPYAPEVVPRPHHFLARNGIVAALADAVVIVEAATRSGALNTASWAADRSVPVLCFPGDVDRPKVAGCLALIRDGAILVRDADDVLAALPVPLVRLPRAERWRTAPRTDDPPPARAVLAALRDGERDVETLAATAGFAPGVLLPALAELEIAGRIERRSGGYALAPNEA
jgi:DNA processing protein